MLNFKKKVVDTFFSRVYTYPWIDFQLGQFYLSQGEFSKAFEHFQQSIGNEPLTVEYLYDWMEDHGGVKEMVASVYFPLVLTGKYDEAEKIDAYWPDFPTVNNQHPIFEYGFDISWLFYHHEFEKLFKNKDEHILHKNDKDTFLSRDCNFKPSINIDHVHEFSKAIVKNEPENMRKLFDHYKLTMEEKMIYLTDIFFIGLDFINLLIMIDILEEHDIDAGEPARVYRDWRDYESQQQ